MTYREYLTMLTSRLPRQVDAELQAECMRILNGPAHVTALLSVLSSSPDARVVAALSTVCYNLLTAQAHVHHNRLGAAFTSFIISCIEYMFSYTVRLTE